MKFTSWNDFFRLQVAFFFRKYASAIFLHIEAQFPGAILTLMEIRAEIPVQKRNTEFFGSLLSHSAHQLVVLVRADEQGRGEGIKTMFGGILGCPAEPHFVTFDTAAGDVVCNGANEGTKTVVVLFHQRKLNGCGIVPQCVSAASVFRERMDIGIVPVAGYIDAFLTKCFDAHVGAGCTAYHIQLII